MHMMELTICNLLQQAAIISRGQSYSIVLMNPSKQYQPLPHPKEPKNKDTVIVLSSDQDNQQELERKLHDKRYRYQVTKSLLTGSRFHLLLTVTKQFMKGSPKDKDKTIKDMIVAFIKERIKIDMENEHFCPRIERLSNIGVQQCFETKYLLYGTDFRSCRQLQQKFARYSPKITRINGSHCVLQFGTFQSGEEFLKTHISNFKVESIVPSRENPYVLAIDWLELNSYIELIFQRRLYIRNLTKLDSLSISSSNETQRYEQAKQALFNKLASEENVKAALEMVEKDEANEQSIINQQRYCQDKSMNRSNKIRGDIPQPAARRNQHRQRRSRSRTRDKRPKQNPKEKKEANQKGPEQTSFIQLSEASSGLHRLENRFNKFHINSVQISSIQERSRHQVSRINSNEHPFSSNQMSNALNSSHVGIHSQNYNNTPFSMSIDEVGIIQRQKSQFVICQESQDQDIYQILQIPKMERSQVSEVNLNFQIKKKPLVCEQVKKQPEMQVKSQAKHPKKKQTSKDTPSYIDLS